MNYCVQENSFVFYLNSGRPKRNSIFQSIICQQITIKIALPQNMIENTSASPEAATNWMLPSQSSDRSEHMRDTWHSWFWNLDQKNKLPEELSELSSICVDKDILGWDSASAMRAGVQRTITSIKWSEEGWGRTGRRRQLGNGKRGDGGSWIVESKQGI